MVAGKTELGMTIKTARVFIDDSILSFCLSMGRLEKLMSYLDARFDYLMSLELQHLPNVGLPLFEETEQRNPNRVDCTGKVVQEVRQYFGIFVKGIEKAAMFAKCNRRCNGS